MTGTIVSVTRSGQIVTGSVRTNEGDGTGDREYTATVPAVDAQGQPLTLAQVRAALVTAWQAQRALRPQPPVDLTGQAGGTVNL